MIRGTLAVILALAGLVGLSWGGYLTYLKVVEGPAITQHTLNVRHSIGYVDAQNASSRLAIENYQSAAKGDTAHQCSALAVVRSNSGQLASDEVATDVRQFLAIHSNECAGSN